jgi:hypothetical protein
MRIEMIRQGVVVVLRFCLFRLMFAVGMGVMPILEGRFMRWHMRVKAMGMGNDLAEIHQRQDQKSQPQYPDLMPFTDSHDLLA